MPVIDPRSSCAALAFFLSSALAACLVNADVQSNLVDVVVQPPGPLTTTKLGGVATFQMSLQGVALGSATVELQSSNTSLGQPVPQTFFYAQDAWTVPQQVDVVGGDDGVVGDENYTLSFDLHGTSFLVDYTQTNTVPLQLIAVDNVPAILAPYVIAGNSATVNVRLRTAPAAPVSLTLRSASALSVSPTVLTFSPSDYDVSQVVMVTFASGATPLVSFTASSSDGRYNGVSLQIQLRQQ